MTVAFWIVSALSAFVFVVAGVFKLVRPVPVLKQSGLGWVDDFSPLTVKLISLAEAVGGAGLILPVLTGYAPILSPIAGLCVAVLMGGAVVIHLRRSEPPALVIVLTLLPLAAAVLGLLVILGS